MLKGMKASKEHLVAATKWLDYIKDDSIKKAVPILPGRFQAELPEWIGPPNIETTESDECLKWLGTQIWPIKTTDTKETTEDNNVGRIGKGKSDELCECESPGSVECVRRHVTDERIMLQSELGSAFWEWRFDEMGEEVSNQWTLEEQHKFESIVKTNPLSQGKSFLKPTKAALPSHNTQSILSYYLNVYLPRRFSRETRSDDKTTADTDDEETSEATNSNTSRKKRHIKVRRTGPGYIYKSAM